MSRFYMDHELTRRAPLRCREMRTDTRHGSDLRSSSSFLIRDKMRVRTVSKAACTPLVVVRHSPCFRLLVLIRDLPHLELMMKCWFGFHQWATSDCPFVTYQRCSRLKDFGFKFWPCKGTRYEYELLILFQIPIALDHALGLWCPLNGKPKLLCSDLTM